MRRCFGVLVVLSMMMGVLVGCGGREPNPVASQRNVNIAIQAIEIADSFLDGAISARVAHGQVESLEPICTDKTGNVMEDTANLLLSARILLLQTGLSSTARNNTLENRNRVLESRNNVAEFTGTRIRR